MIGSSNEDDRFSPTKNKYSRKNFLHKSQLLSPNTSLPLVESNLNTSTYYITKNKSSKHSRGLLSNAFKSSQAKSTTVNEDYPGLTSNRSKCKMEI